MTTDFEEMDKAEVDPLWLNFHDGGYTIEDENEPIEEQEGPAMLVLTEIEGNVGENNSRLYTGYMDGFDRPVKFWGKGHINRQVDQSDIQAGNEIGILKTGETIDTGEDEPMQVFDVRYS